MDQSIANSKSVQALINLGRDYELALRGRKLKKYNKQLKFTSHIIKLKQNQDCNGYKPPSGSLTYPIHIKLKYNQDYSGHKRPTGFLSYPDPLVALVTLARSISDSEESEWLFYGAYYQASISSQGGYLLWENVPWSDLHAGVSAQPRVGTDSKKEIALLELEALGLDPSEREVIEKRASGYLHTFVTRRCKKNSKRRRKLEYVPCKHEDCADRCCYCCWCGKRC